MLFNNLFCCVLFCYAASQLLNYQHYDYHYSNDPGLDQDRFTSYRSSYFEQKACWRTSTALVL